MNSDMPGPRRREVWPDPEGYWDEAATKAGDDKKEKKSADKVKEEKKSTDKAKEEK